MANSAPEVSFSVGSINYGTIDVGGSSAWTQYSIYQAGNSTSWVNAINMSISFKESTNASEARKESWVRVSTVSEDTVIESVGGKEAYVGSTYAAGGSTVVKTLVSVPLAATTAGRVAFFLHHRLRAVMRLWGEGTSILASMLGGRRISTVAGFSYNQPPLLL